MALPELFVRAAARRPLLLVIDDLQFADGPSLRLLEFLSRHSGQAPLLLLVAHRDADIDLSVSVRETVARIRRHDRCERAVLRGLDREAVAALVQAAGLEAVSTADRIDHLHRRTEGNPFFVRELLRHAQDCGSFADDVPPPVRDLVRMRMSRLSAACVELLETAAVLGNEWRAQVVRGLAEMPADSFLPLVEEAVSAGIVERIESTSDRFGFAHCLIRDALYRGLSTHDCQRLHRTALSWLERHDALSHASELAHHAYYSATLDDGQRALTHITRAAEEATRHFAYEDAAIQYGRALEVIGPSTEHAAATRCSLLIGLGESQIRSGERAAALRSFDLATELARALGSGPLLARIALGRAPGLISLEVGREDRTLIELLGEALRACPEDPELRSQLLARLAVARAWSATPEERLQLVGEAIAAADSSNSARAQAFARGARCMALWSPANLESRVHDTVDALRWAVRAGDRELGKLCANDFARERSASRCVKSSVVSAI
jgi:eukaryotic-like serine/threonine-protein kinase